MLGIPLGTFFMLMHPSTGQTSEHMLQPTQIGILTIEGAGLDELTKQIAKKPHGVLNKP